MFLKILMSIGIFWIVYCIGSLLSVRFIRHEVYNTDVFSKEVVVSKANARLIRRAKDILIETIKLIFVCAVWYGVYLMWAPAGGK